MSKPWYIPKHVYLGHDGKNIEEAVEKFPYIGDEVKDAQDDNPWTDIVDLPPKKRRKYNPPPTPNANMTGQRGAFGSYHRKRGYKKSARPTGFHRPTALNLIETKRASPFILGPLSLVNRNENIVNLLMPGTGSNPEGDLQYNGNRIYALGYTFWLTLRQVQGGNPAQRGNVRVYMKVFGYEPEANPTDSDIYHDVRTDEPTTLFSLPFPERGRARVEKGKNFVEVYRKSWLLHNESGNNSGKSEAHLKFFIPIKEILRITDDENDARVFNKTYQVRWYATYNDNRPSGDTLVEVDYSYTFYFKDA